MSYQKFLLLQSEGQLEESLDVSNELLMCYFRNIQRLNMIMFNEKRRAKKRPPNITEGLCVCACACTCMRVWMGVWVGASVRACVCVYVCVCVSMYVCLCLCLRAHLYSHTVVVYFTLSKYRTYFPLL